MNTIAVTVIKPSGIATSSAKFIQPKVFDIAPTQTTSKKRLYSSLTPSTTFLSHLTYTLHHNREYVILFEKKIYENVVFEFKVGKKLENPKLAILIGVPGNTLWIRHQDDIDLTSCQNGVVMGKCDLDFSTEKLRGLKRKIELAFVVKSDDGPDIRFGLPLKLLTYESQTYKDKALQSNPQKFEFILLK